MANIANIAAKIHANMCEDPGFGYSWEERYGTAADSVTWNIEGHNYTVNRGDYDCSSSVCTAWQKALEGTEYEGTLNGATYTGNMRSVFVNSGLFDVWDTNSTSAVRGDVYLNDSSHTAMCQDGGNDGVYGYDALSEFSINEHGGTYGGQRGDQTEGESRIAGFYNYPWDCTLHYNGKADDNTQPSPEPTPQPSPSSNRLHVIDIASWQEGIIPSQTSADAVIIKVSGGTHYENPFWRQWADDVLASGKALGLYHYAVESEDNPQARAEAEFFLSKVEDYIGKFIPVLDWEADALSLPADWAREWMDIVAERTGATPWFYGYASDINSKDYSAITNYPLWMASYLNKYQGANFLDDPDQTWGYGNWQNAIAYQYTSTGRISGYDDDLDLSVAYCSAADWNKMCADKEVTPSPTPSPSSDQPRYAAYTSEQGWLTEMEGLKETDGGNDDYAGIFGVNIRYIGINGVGKYRVYTENSGWLPYVDHFDYNDEEYGMAGDGSNIVALEIPNSNIKYQVHTIQSGWLSPMKGNTDTGGSSDFYAGIIGEVIDAICIWKA